jgi:3-dehydroquinate dehydratase type I
LAKPSICGVIVENDIAAIKRSERLVDLFELRIDLAGRGWEQTAIGLKKPWIATNRSTACGGRWKGNEKARVKELLKALELGAAIVDVEIEAPELAEIVPVIKRHARCLISSHDWEGTASLAKLSSIVRRQKAAGADICKIVTTATKFSDNLIVLELLYRYRDMPLVSFAMGKDGRLSRVLSPLAGGYFTYAALEADSISAPGQMTVRELADIFRMVGT